ncbi:lipoate--protein ligase B [Arthrobacter sp. MYb211]|uniref:lipoyl(octanoyl) transferase LipB n=1 Tax=Micrococcaceae TaxID=1268 RepID=UPI000CFE28B0|nr:MULTISPECIES: lipoyl(octanoyl) transferase LipB [unclassified Arthrobacter]PRA01456.1 lipoate--protein ligase B [Arthrobacter sp. MYb224]PRA06352.1 lipoate--protein ligase B [Arthrobacter sp. MYb229]PRA12849.1 lipoate--protein ligase B [Arthrobacter sp. MYb221]PRB53254.1 lipoate--protein ligase B [Arthrobacter sp. MYb216]PRC09768.1 lipoate--protein ligase B [Arthrobacter sp. MYb211]
MAIEFERVGLGTELIPYMQAWDYQQKLHDAVAADEQTPRVLFLEHEAVYTAGKRTEPEDLPLDGTPVVDVDRGGKLTWHGPGQLIGYPIVKLKKISAIRLYVETLEEALINVIDEMGIPTVQVKGRSGVWVPGKDGEEDRKIAAIGIRITRGVTMHGFALNCSNDLTAYGQIIPCGITDAGVTTISEELGQTVSPNDVVERVQEELERLLSPQVV